MAFAEKTWVTDDAISTDELNRMETGIDDAHDDIDAHVHDGTARNGVVLDHGGLSGKSDNDHPQYVLKTGIDHYYDELTANVSGLSSGWNIIPLGTLSPLTIYPNTGDILQIRAMARVNGLATVWVGISDGVVTSVTDANILFGWSTVISDVSATDQHLVQTGVVAVDHKWTTGSATRYIYMGVNCGTVVGRTLYSGSSVKERYTRLSVTRIPTA